MEHPVHLWYKAFKACGLVLHRAEIAHCGSLQEEVSSIRLWKFLGLENGESLGECLREVLHTLALFFVFSVILFYFFFPLYP